MGFYYNINYNRSTSLLLARFKNSLSSTRTIASSIIIRNARNLKSIALRREDKSRWERRVALTPDAVSKLIKETDVKIYVQPCNKRVFNNDSYLKAGAIVQEDISNADIVMGIKEVAIKSLIPNKTYVFFSHTHKGQLYNMEMLKHILDKEIQLIDYELMTDVNNKRSVLFGTHAGYSGMIDGLHGLGLRLLGLGYNTPFMHIAMSHSYKSLDNAIATVKELGNSIAKDGLPNDFNPMTFVFTGTGNVSKGAQHIFQNLPHENIDAKDLKECISDKHKFSNKKIYGCQVKLEDYLIRKDTGKFVSKSDYYSNPDKYLSEFHSKIAPYTSMLIHGSYWDTKFPRLITTKQLQEIQSNPTIKNRLLCISDISCDINGALEFLSHSTTIDDPFYYVDAVNNKEHKSDDGQGTQIMAVDILPTEIPLESSKHFSKSLYPFMKDLINDNIENNTVLSNATITKDGKLMDRHKKLYNLLPKSTINSTTTTSTTTGTDANTEINTRKVTRNNHIKKKILLLGSGFVAKPFVDYLSAKNDLDLIIASNAKEETFALTQGNPNIQIVNLDVNNKQDLSGLVERSDVVVSFIPAPLHPIVAEQCILHGKHMITASYISPEMKALDERAKQANITILNEIGVDPGIDHLSAMKVIDEVRDQGGEITSFISWCGGLPAPEASNVPLGYKFSWSPKGVLTAALNEAKFWMNGKYQEIPGGDLLKSHFPSVLTYPGFAFEGLANRNSLSYIDTYGLSPLETKKAMFRGTLRYKGYSDLMYSFYKLGLLDTEPFKNSTFFNNWSDFFDNLLFNKLNGNGHMMMITESDRITAISEKLNLAKDHYMIDQVVDSLKWLSLMSSTNNNNNNNLSKPKDITSSSIAPIDLFCILLQQKLKYNPHERDLLVLHHEFGIKLKNGQDQIKTSSLVSYGTLDTYTAMAKTVGLPSAIAAEMIARGEIKETGILSPTTKSTYLPILEKLENEGIKIVENVECYRKETSEKLECSGSGIWN